MRRVFTPPPANPGWLGPSLAAVLLTVAVFLILPLTQMVSSGVHRKLYLSKVDATQLAPPPDVSDAPSPPPPPEPQQEPPPPTLADAPRPMQLSVDLDIAIGTGGAMAYGTGLPGGDGGADAGALEAFNVSDLEKRPEIIASVAPVYPSELRRARVDGYAVVQFIVDEEGRVQDPRVSQSSHPEFEKPALEAIRRWKFKPAMKDGNAAAAFTSQRFSFSSRAK